MSTALLSPTDQQTLAMARGEVGSGPIAPTIPQIKLASFGSAISYDGPTDVPAGSVQDVDDGQGRTGLIVAPGTYYISQREKNDDGNYEDKITPIGPNPEVVILKRLYSYSWYSEKQKRLMAWTNELAGFGHEQDVFLINNRNEKPFLEKRLPYPEFKEYMLTHYVDAEGGKLLKFRNVLYVLYNGKPYRMSVSNASVTGIPEGQKTGDYKKPEPGSLMAFQNALSGPEPESLAFFQKRCRLGSTLVRSSLTFFVMTFEDAGLIEDLPAMLATLRELQNDLVLRFKNDFGPFLRTIGSAPSGPEVVDSMRAFNAKHPLDVVLGPGEQEIDLPDFEAPAHTPSVDPSDLPF